MNLSKLIAGAMVLSFAWGCDKPVEEPEAQPAEAPVVEAENDPAAAAPEKSEEAPAVTVATIGQPAPDFELKDETGKAHKLSDYKGKIVVLEWTNPDCPYVERHYKAKTMQTTWDKLGQDKVVWLAVDSSNFVKPEASASWKAKDGFSFPVLQDPSGEVGKLYEAKTTPHMYVVDAEGTLRYNGAIDDDERGKNETVVNHVEKAVGELLQGKDVETSRTKPYGCSVKYSS